MNKKNTPYYRFVYFIAEPLIFFQFLLFILLSLNFGINLNKSVVSILVSFAISEAIKAVYHKQRPKRPLLGPRVDTSFPSSHSTIAFAISFSSLLFGGGIILFLLNLPMSIFVAVGRVLGGAHFKIDTIAGAILAFIVCLIVYFLNLEFNFSL